MFARTVVAIACLCSILDLSVADERNAGARRLAQEGRRQLFLDNAMVHRMSGVKRIMHVAQKHPSNPVIRQGQTAWNEYRTQLYGTVLYDEQKSRFRMWYLSGAQLPHRNPIMLNGMKRIPNFQLVGYAESLDGFNWTLPELGLTDYNGSKANNICSIARTNVEGIAVIRDDRDPNENRRYKALYWEHSASDPEPFPGINGMSASYSADGIRWMNETKNPVIPFGSDTGQQVIYDAQRKKFVAFGRFNAGGRKVARAESADFVKWSRPSLVFSADSKDPPGTQVYGMGVSFYEGIYIGLPWMFYAGTDDRIDVQLATSRDGSNWKRVLQGQQVVPNGPPGSWDAGIVFTASQPIQVKGDRIFIFYSASKHNHNYAHLKSDKLKKGSPEWFKRIREVGTSIGVATLRRDGFVSLTAGQQMGEVVTRTFRWPVGGVLHINADASKGKVHVDVVNAENEQRNLAQTRILNADRTDARVMANSQKLAGELVRLKFRLQDASLYSWWIGK